MIEWFSSRRPPREPKTTVVIFDLVGDPLAKMDVALGPCVPLPGRKKSLCSVHRQEGRESPDRMRDFFVVLGGEPADRDSALELIARSGKGSLYRLSERFVDLMAAENQEALRLGELDKANGDNDFSLFAAHREKLDRAWVEMRPWHRTQVSLRNKLSRTAYARRARTEGRSLYCWYGPPIPEYVIVQGSGPYPGFK